MPAPPLSANRFSIRLMDHAASSGQMLVMLCKLCGLSTNYWADDLVKVVGPGGCEVGRNTVSPVKANSAPAMTGLRPLAEACGAPVSLLPASADAQAFPAPATGSQY